jgi:hypothetical protein
MSTTGLVAARETIVAKPPPVRIDERTSARPVTDTNARSKEVLEFWERRAGRKLSLRTAREMQSNVEGVIGLLAQWDRKDCAESDSVVRLREQHDPAKG